MFPWRHAPNQWRTWCLVKFDLFMISKITYNKNIQQEIEHCNNYVWQKLNVVLITWRGNQLFLHTWEHQLGLPKKALQGQMKPSPCSSMCFLSSIAQYYYWIISVLLKVNLDLHQATEYTFETCTHKCIYQLCLMVSSLKHKTGFTGHKM